MRIIDHGVMVYIEPITHARDVHIVVRRTGGVNINPSGRQAGWRADWRAGAQMPTPSREIAGREGGGLHRRTGAHTLVR